MAVLLTFLRPKYWVKSCSPVFVYYTLDMAICPYLASIFGMPIWHPTKEEMVDELLKAEVMPLLVLSMPCMQ